MSARPLPVPPLGRRLLAEGRVTEAAITQGLARQEAVGGHLDTALLELDLIAEADLLAAVAATSGFPPADADQLRGVADEIIGLIPVKLARRGLVMPFALASTSLSVALVDPRNLALHDELSFVSGKRIVAHVALELRVREALEKYFDEPLPPRFAQLVDRLNRARYMWDGASGERRSVIEPQRPHAAPTPASAGPDAPPGTEGRHRQSASAPDLGRGAFDVGGWTPPPLPSFGRAAAPVAAVPAPAPMDLEAFEARLAVLGDRGQIGTYLLAFLRRSFPRVILFTVRRDVVSGWLGSGPGVDLASLDTFQLSIEEPSLFADLAREDNFHVGPLPPLPAHRRLASLWGGQLPRRCLLVPVRIRERLVTVIYCELGTTTPPLDVYALQRLSAATSQAFEFCIIRKKMDQASD